jgi:chromate transport protein ChrA
MKDELVVQGKWISMKRFVRAYAAYQVLPGPEATELACYFGMLAGGPLGGLLGGLGFIAPGVLLMLLFSWFYVTCASEPVLS